MTRLLTLLTIALIVSVAFAQPPAALQTPGLDTDADRDGLPDGWHKYVAFPGQAKTAVDAAVKSEGPASLRVELAPATRCAVSQLIRVTDPGPYTFGCRLYGTKAPATVQTQIQWFKTVDWPRQIALVKEDPASPAVTASEVWTVVAATGAKPDDADLALVVISATSPKDGPASVWLDDASWRPGAFPAPLVMNPSFELDLNADNQPDGWGASQYGGGFELVRDATVAHTGQASARLTGTKDHGDRSCYVQASPLFTPPGKVRLSFWYKGAGLSTGIMHLLTPAGVQKPGGGIEYGVMTFTPKLSDQWQKFSQEIAVPDEAKKAGIMRVDIILYQKGEGALWYDDVEVELLP
ncbi:MAG: hypothetical protein ABFE08_10715 [Armatimonadia bacterium]